MVCPLKTFALTFGICIFVAPSVAAADVIQSGPEGFSWISGPSAPNQFMPEGSISRPKDDGFTEVGETAGPAPWQDHVAVLAAKYDISPSLLEAVVWQESRWRTGATSRAGAHGLAQLMPATARQMGVDIGNPYANLEGGARYLRIQLDAFGGDVEKALAAYNAGPGRVQSAHGVPNIPETKAYVAAIMSRLSDRVRR
jgi:soluble lytic murein transglycosylase-like protein